MSKICLEMWKFETIIFISWVSGVVMLSASVYLVEKLHNFCKIKKEYYEEGDQNFVIIQNN